MISKHFVLGESAKSQGFPVTDPKLNNLEFTMLE
jgi:hypothetical protein